MKRTSLLVVLACLGAVSLGAEEPPPWQLDNRERVRVAACVRSLGEVPPETLPGDASRGRALFEGKVQSRLASS